jgi:hypothetical protein
MKCGSVFDEKYHKKHKHNMHGGKCVKMKHLGAPENLFKLVFRNFEEESNNELDR